MTYIICLICFLTAFSSFSQPWEGLTPEEQDHLSQVYAAQGISESFKPGQGTPAVVDQEAFKKLFNQVDSLDLAPLSLKENILLLKNPSELLKSLTMGWIGTSSSVAWGSIFASNRLMELLYSPREGGELLNSTGASNASAIFMALPNILSLKDAVFLAEGIGKNFKERMSEASWRKRFLHTLNFGLAAQGTYNAYVVVSGVAWNSRFQEVRESVDGWAYTCAASYMLTSFLDTWMNGRDLVTRVENTVQQRLNHDALGAALQKSAVRAVQSQLMRTYQTLSTAEDATILRLRAALGGLNTRAKTEEEKSQAQLLSFLALVGLGAGGDLESLSDFKPQEKPTSLKACEWTGGVLGGLVFPWAVFGSYFVADQANRYDPNAYPDTGGYNLEPTMNNPKAWLYALTLGTYVGVTGFLNGRELGRKVWSDWTGQDLNFYRTSPEFYPQNLAGARALTRLVTYGLSCFLMIPVAGLTMDQFYTTWNFYERDRSQAVLAAMLPSFGVLFHEAFDGHYQHLTTLAAKWLKGDPIGSARDDLNHMLMNYYAWSNTLSPVEAGKILSGLQGMTQKAAEEGVYPAETSFSGMGTPETVGSPSSRSSGSERSSEGTGSPRASLNEPLLGDHERSWEGAAEDDAYLLEEEGAEPTPSWWGRTKAWLVGKPVPDRLKHLVDQIYAPADPVPASSEA